MGQMKYLGKFWNHQMYHKMTPLWIAAFKGNLDVVEILLNHGANIDTLSDLDYTALHCAVIENQLPVVQLLVKSMAKINIPTVDGTTCLMSSVKNLDICKFLLQSGADMKLRDKNHKTALHYAIVEERLEAVKVLLEFMTNFLGQIDFKHALDLAESVGNPAICSFLSDQMKAIE